MGSMIYIIRMMKMISIVLMSSLLIAILLIMPISIIKSSSTTMQHKLSIYRLKAGQLAWRGRRLLLQPCPEPEQATKVTSASSTFPITGYLWLITFVLYIPASLYQTNSLFVWLVRRYWEVINVTIISSSLWYFYHPSTSWLNIRFLFLDLRML